MKAKEEFEVEGTVEEVKEEGERGSSFPWIENFKNTVETFHQRPRDIFSIWFEECRKDGEFMNSLHALLTILVHSRFDQANRSATKHWRTPKGYSE